MLLLCATGHLLARGNLFFDTRISSSWSDVQTGARLGDEEDAGPFRVAGFLDAEFRPLPSGTTVTVMDAWRFHVTDAPYSLGTGAAVIYPLGPGVSAVLATGVGYAVCREGDAEGDPGWACWVDVGFRIPFAETSSWGLAYQYHPMAGAPDHRRALQFRLRAI